MVDKYINLPLCAQLKKENNSVYSQYIKEILAVLLTEKILSQGPLFENK